jgi:uncharacterized SAM-binding protein YcdF (DUF218 family)
MTRMWRICGWTPLAAALFFLTPLSYFYGMPLLVDCRPERADVIVLLSSGLLRDDWVTPDAAQRTLGAIRLYREGYAARIISSGSHLGKGHDQAAAQAGWLRRAGIPEEAILIENRSTRTYESGVEVARIMKERDWRTAVIVTSELDVPRVQRVFAKQGVAASFLAVPEFPVPRKVLYLSSGYAVAYHATYEYLALVEYWWRGWI